MDENEGIQEDDQFGPYDHQLAIMGEPYSGESPPLFHQFDTQVSRRLLFIRIKFRNRFLMGCFPSKIEIESRILPDFWPFSYHWWAASTHWSGTLDPKAKFFLHTSTISSDSNSRWVIICRESIEINDLDVQARYCFCSNSYCVQYLVKSWQK